MDDDEREAVQAVYCLPGECCFEGNKVTVNILVDVTSEGNGFQGTKLPVQIILTLGSKYPLTAPDVSILSEHLNRDNISRIKSAVAENCAVYVGEPMLIAMYAFLQDEIKQELKNVIADRISHTSLADFQEKDMWTTILHIDHMRSKNKYCKTLERWAEELKLNGRIVFFRRLILVLLQGNHDSIKEFILRLRTVNVDVDSKGHSCKERMMKVLSERKCDSSSSARFQDFLKCDIMEEPDLHNIFSQHGLEENWESVIPLLK